MDLSKYFDGKVVAITGSVGSVGKSLVSFLTELPVKEIVVIDNNESALHEQDIEYKSDGRITPRLMDITCLLYTSPSPRDATLSRMPSSA